MHADSHSASLTQGAVLRIGTRGSPLALAQAHDVRRRLAAAHPALAPEPAVAIVIIKTSGDIILDRPLADIGGKGLFTKEIEEALLDRRIDLAVHSMKDVPTRLPDGLVIAAVLPREDPRDALFAPGGDPGACGLARLPHGALVGTASLRRQALLRLARPDLRVASLRGNVGTRLAKLRAGEVDATLLAQAGLNRLGHPAVPDVVLEPEELLPAVAQGAVGIEIRDTDARTRAYLAALDDPPTATRIAAERACLAALDGSCRTPIAAYAALDAEGLWLRAIVAKPDGSHAVRGALHGIAGDAAAIGTALGRQLLGEAGPAYLA